MAQEVSMYFEVSLERDSLDLVLKKDQLTWSMWISVFPPQEKEALDKRCVTQLFTSCSLTHPTSANFSLKLFYFYLLCNWLLCLPKKMAQKSSRFITTQHYFSS